MAFILINESKTSALTLHYGEGMSNKLQINPNKRVECPAGLKRGLLQHYLAVFKELKLIDDQNNAPKGDKKDATEENTVELQESQEEAQTSNGTESTESSEINEGDSKDGENNSDGTVILDEKALLKLNAKKIKEIAESLGIEVTEDSTKKALIPIILNKQGK